MRLITYLNYVVVIVVHLSSNPLIISYVLLSTPIYRSTQNCTKAHVWKPLATYMYMMCIYVYMCSCKI